MDEHIAEYNKIVKDSPYKGGSEDAGRDGFYIKKFSLLKPVEEISYSNHTNLYSDGENDTGRREGE